jgi:hypothetical protein
LQFDIFLICSYDSLFKQKHTQGDSGYTTYLKNPTTIDEGLTAAGAERIGEMGKADASEIGDKAQDKVIARWMDDIWLPLGTALVGGDDDDGNTSTTTTAEALKEMQARTIPILKEIDPDYEPPKDLLPQKSTTTGGGGGGGMSMGIAISCLIGAVVAAVAAISLSATK